jgi:hypothetical protein
MIALLVVNTIQAQTRTGFEGYYYTGCSANSALVPRVYFQSSSNWYGEARYNYESGQTLSLYAGHSFSHEKDLTWSVTPMVGVVAGKFRGVSPGANATLEIKRVSLISTVQYTASTRNSDENFFFGWTELGYHLTDHLYTGAVLQQTGLCKSHSSLDPGLQLTFSAGAWQIPVYFFSPQGAHRYWVLGVNREWVYGKPINHAKATNTP